MSTTLKSRLENLSIAMYAYTDLEGTLGQRVSGIKDRVRKDGSFVMIPFDPVEFCRVLRRVQDDYLPYDFNNRRKFVDVGAGLGFKVRIAKEFGFEADGIEFDKRYIEFARKYFGTNLIYKDALKANYKDYDVIYFYQPMCDGEKQEQLEDRIISTMKDDAIVIPMSNHTFWRDGHNRDKVRCLDKHGYLYTKKGSSLKKVGKDEEATKAN